MSPCQKSTLAIPSPNKLTLNYKAPITPLAIETLGNTIAKGIQGLCSFSNLLNSLCYV